MILTYQVYFKVTMKALKCAQSKTKTCKALEFDQVHTIFFHGAYD